MLRHLPPIASILVFLLVARQIYPYSSFNTPTVDDGFEISVVATNLGGPTCLEWFDESTLIVCDRDGGQIYAFDMNMSKTVLIDGLDRPHDVAITDSNLFVSEAGKLSRYVHDGQLGEIENKTTLISNVPTGNHQTNAVNILPNGTLVWHSGSTCNICVEDDPRNGALLWVNGSTGEHGILASGVRNSFDGAWVADIGYVFTDNGRDWEGDHPDEELNLLVEGGDYGWPDDDPSNPVPAGSIGPIATWTPHTSMNGVAVRPANSPLPGGNSTIYATVYGSWNTILPQGHEIVRIDLDSSNGKVVGTTSVFAEDVGTPLPITFHPNGDLYFAVFGSNGKLYKITAAIQNA
ncbi:MAG: PQQ-dependent sugar dehydrogenase [Candidatus Poseidoniaceae archaeon]